MSKPFYITTTLPYVNADPHIGFAFELISADIVARYKRLLGDEVFFNTGTDEHGTKVWEKAKEEGKDTQAYTDEYAEKFKKLRSHSDYFPTLISSELPTRTTNWRRRNSGSVCGFGGYL